MMKKAERVCQDLLHFKAPDYESIPPFELYMDQLIVYINEALEPLNFDTSTPAITRSMINNYVKNSIVKPPVKKHYKSYHVVYIFVVCILKKCYSLSQIQQLIQVYSNIEDTGRFHRDFNKFMHVFEDCLHEVMATGQSTRTYFDNPTPEQQLMIDVIQSIVFKIYAEYNLLLFNEQQQLASTGRKTSPKM